MKVGDLVKNNTRWYPASETRVGIVVDICKAGPIDQREDGNIVFILWDDGVRPQFWDHKIEVLSEQ